MFNLIDFNFEFIKLLLCVAAFAICFANMSFLQHFFVKASKHKNVMIMMIGLILTCPSCIGFQLGLALSGNLFAAAFCWLFTFLGDIYIGKIKY